MKISSNVEAITPKKAAEMLKMNNNNRNINKRTVAAYAQQMQDGKWHFTADPIQFLNNGNLGNGQHRLTAIVESGTTQQMTIVRGLDPEIFNVLDCGRKRTTGDAFSIHGYTNPNQLAATVTRIMRFKQGKYSKSADNSSHLPNEDKVNWVEEHEIIHEIVKDAAKYYQSCNRIMSQTIIGAFMYLFREKNVEASEEFWRKLCITMDSDPKSPIRKIYNIFMKQRLKDTRYTERELMAMLIKAWNAYRSNKSGLKVSFDSKKESFPEII